MDVNFSGCLRPVNTLKYVYLYVSIVYMSLLATVWTRYARPSVATACRGIGFPTGDISVLSRKIGRFSCSNFRDFMYDVLVMPHAISI